MTKPLAVAAALSALTVGTPAFAGSITATLEQPIAKPMKLIAGGAVWMCEGASCVARMADERAATIDSCASLAKAIGRVTDYSDGLRPFDASRLIKCNAGVRSATAAVGNPH